MGELDCCPECCGGERLGITHDELRAVHGTGDDGPFLLAARRLGDGRPFSLSPEGERAKSAFALTAVKRALAGLRQSAAARPYLLPGSAQFLEVSNRLVVCHAVAIVRDDHVVDSVQVCPPD